MPKRKPATTPTPRLETFTLRTTLGREVTVDAKDEDDARRLVMIAVYGKTADRVIPHAPNYRGTGLLLVSPP